MMNWPTELKCCKSDNPKVAPPIKFANTKMVELISLLLALTLGDGLAHAQQPKKIPRIGYVSVSGVSNAPGLFVETFRQKLRELGHIEGQNVLIEFRYAAEKPDQIPRFVSEMVQLPVDVLVLSSAEAIRTAKQATKTIPIVIVTSQDPVATGLVDSLARPGGNITGLTRFTRELSGKRLELLKETFPQMARVGLLGNQGGAYIKDYEAAALSLKIPIQLLEVRRSNPDIDETFQAAVKARVSALIVAGSSQINNHRKRINELAIEKKLPSMHEVTTWVDRGGLMSYSSDDRENFRRAAIFVDKILKGTKPSDLPVEQPMKFEFVVNLTTAKQIGLTIPPEILARANRIIR